MGNLLVAFPTREQAVNVRNILVRSGIEVSAVCLTGAKTLQHTDTWNDGIIVCGYRLQDMHYRELRDCLPEQFDLLLVAPAQKWEGGLPDGVVGMPLPLKLYDLVNTVEMMLQTQERRRKRRRETVKKRDEVQQKVISQAKALLMERNSMAEEEAHRYLQKSSMASGTNLYETAQMILTIMNE